MLDFTRYYLLDGGMGTMLQARGLEAGGAPERLNLERPDVVREVHRAYVAAGADIITTNTFGASAHKLGEDPAPFIRTAISLAREAGAPLVAQDIGPLGAMLEPMGPMPFEEAYRQFAQQIEAGEEADLILIETMSDLLEAKAALLAAKEHSNRPVLVTMTFGEDGRTFLPLSIRPHSNVFVVFEKNARASAPAIEKYSVNGVERFPEIPAESAEPGYVGISENFTMSFTVSPSGNIELAPNLPWKGIVPLSKLFSERLGIPVVVTNDANAAANTPCSWPRPTSRRMRA